MLFDFLKMAFVHPAECIVSIDGNPITDLYPFVTSVSVDATRDRGTEARISFASPVDETDHWTVADDLRLRRDAVIKIQADFTTARQEIMRGIVTSVSPSFPANAGQATVQLRARDDGARLDRRPNVIRHGKPPAGTTDRLLLQAILLGTGLRPDTENAAGQSGLILNQRTTDLVFLQARAAANGYDLLFEEGFVYFGPLRTQGASQPTIMAYAGAATNCRNFSPHNRGEGAEQQTWMRRDAHGEVESEAKTTAPRALMGMSSTRSSGTLAPQHARLDRRTTPNESENEARAKRAALDGQLSISAEGELDGALYGHVLKVGHMVEVDGVGQLNSGQYFVDTVTHHFDSTGYSQRFRLLRDALGRKPGGNLVSNISNVLAG
jgi:phage protein D